METNTLAFLLEGVVNASMKDSEKVSIEERLDKTFNIFLPYKRENTGSQLDIYERVTQLAFDRCKAELLDFITKEIKQAKIDEAELYLAIATSNQNIMPNWVAKITFQERIHHLKQGLISLKKD